MNFKVLRGGSWFNTSVNLPRTIRYRYLPHLTSNFTGFRMVRVQLRNCHSILCSPLQGQSSAHVVARGASTRIACRKSSGVSFRVVCNRASFRVIRGGAWSNLTFILTCAFPYRSYPQLTNSNVGFRVVCAQRRNLIDITHLKVICGGSYNTYMLELPCIINIRINLLDLVSFIGFRVARIPSRVFKAMRGGSCLSPTHDLPCTICGGDLPDVRYNPVGFRVVRDHVSFKVVRCGSSWYFTRYLSCAFHNGGYHVLRGSYIGFRMVRAYQY